MDKQNGFTLLELLLVITVVVVLSAGAVANFRNSTRSTGLDGLNKTIISDLRAARERAIDGENFLHWGIHFDGTNNNYQLFSTPTNYSDAGKTIVGTTYLTSGMTFTAPATGNITDVIFNRISGTAATATVTITAQGISKSANVNAFGTVY
jgi:prepilin-type N-terminal cleavage/methylation domain-containing protein